MSKNTGAVADKQPVVVNGQWRTPPDESLWKRYSPHYEFPLSGVTSTGLHLIVGAVLLIVAMGIWLHWWKWQTNQDFEVIELVGGGGGNVAGVGGGPANGATPEPQKEAVQQPVDPKTPVPAVKFPDLPTTPYDPVAVLPTISNDQGERIIDQGNQAIENMKALNQIARTKMFTNLAGQGGGGTGAGGGTGSGQGTATGNKTGDGSGKGNLSQRQKRLLRWTMVFNTRDGRDYVRQLALLQATIAIPEGDQYRVYRDLRMGGQGQIEDIATIKSIYWVDDRPESVQSLCRGLGVDSAPVMRMEKPHFAAFFPLELEEKLARLEHDFKGLREDQIFNTRFEIINNEPRVTFQEPMKPGR
jgi:hypothetical protein